jgi:hypothetical protein
MPEIHVIKRNGESEPFSEEKVLRSMRRVGVPEDLQPEVVKHIREKVTGDTISTDEVFRHILEFLEPRDRKSSLRFNLRQAIFELGPTGFPFEQYLARIFRDQGYEVEVGIQMQGECVTHEIDLLLMKDSTRQIVEAKFHNSHATKSDIQTALYTYARFLDVKDKNDIDNVWLITNTKLSQDAIVYTQCKGIPAIAWNYPNEGNLQDFVEQPHMYPITILNAFSDAEKKRLVEKDIVLCRDLLEKKDEAFADVLINNENIERARQDAEMICPLPEKK